jgi:hypothetical protein
VGGRSTQRTTSGPGTLSPDAFFDYNKDAVVKSLTGLRQLAKRAAEGADQSRRLLSLAAVLDGMIRRRHIALVRERLMAQRDKPVSMRQPTSDPATPPESVEPHEPNATPHAQGLCADRACH